MREIIICYPTDNSISLSRGYWIWGVRKLNKIKFYRNNLGLSVYKLAELAGLTPSYISNLENDNRTNPSKEVMTNISNALCESVQAVFFPDDDKEDNSWI